ncbi:hypothetical protein AVEN_147511-1 [Araneus ventricosus]|uniref:Uncharacterized protein n=1 Tax=Araneus ventricosus TaxID=182803 RepID=A0A4Y2JL09_ARAVE|nr:hypothetical protein AVEN_147511-1 [Araneus ventricosus]
MQGDVVFLPRIKLAASEMNLPFVLNRRQFPLIPAYTMTIKKSQGQTFDHVGIYLDEPVFSHGQLYVALSKSRIPNHVKIYTKTSEVQGKLLNNKKYFTRNVVYQEIAKKGFGGLEKGLALADDKVLETLSSARVKGCHKGFHDKG